ncbi:hypothetical protein EXIGLDRAFT_477912 [Exidia glandulosa HHB12029]|uniref:Uncharacterized protein n=1 Tax=Exidia glandulosa HHB12029 TaxID=1314781 RepID=A0A166NJ09_EXIGL|nr:hypothetical protein EXIGLDRAFT_477912 [Exidia glandulosa HHB12029]
MPQCLHQGQDIHDAVTALSVELQLPDASQRQPLCEIIRDIETYGPQLRAYFAKHAEDDHALAALALVLSRLCVDPRLRSVIIQTYMPKDFFPVILREHRCPMAVVAGLQFASTILSGSSNRRYCFYVMGSLSSILDALMHFSDGTNLVSELSLDILDRMTRYILTLPGSRRLRVALDLVERVRHLDGDALNAVLPVVFGVMSEPLRASASEDEIETLQSFCTGVFRASWPRARLLALRCIQDLVRNVEPRKEFHPGKFLQGRSTWRSSRMWSILEKHGLQSCATLRLADQMEAFLDAAKGFTLTKDTRALALRMFSLIVQDPRSVWFDEYFTRKTGIGRRTPRQFGVRCDDWKDILLHCAAEVEFLSRAELLAIVPQHLLGACTGVDVSNILKLHHCILTHNSGEILELCRSLPEEKLASRHSFYAYALHTLPIAHRWEALLQELEAKSSVHSTLFTAALARRINRLYLSITPTLDAGQQDDDWQSISQRVYTVMGLCKKYMDLTPPDAPDRACVEEIRHTLYLLVRHPDDLSILHEVTPLLEEWLPINATTKTCGAAHS